MDDPHPIPNTSIEKSGMTLDACKSQDWGSEGRRILQLIAQLV